MGNMNDELIPLGRLLTKAFMDRQSCL